MSTIIGEILQQKQCGRTTYDEMKKESRGRKVPIQNMIIDSGLVHEKEFFHIASKVFEGPIVDQEEEIIDASCAEMIPYELAKRYGVFPIRKESKGLLLAMSNPHDLVALNDIGFIVDMPLNPALCTKSQVSGFIKKYYVRGKLIHELLHHAGEDAGDEGENEDDDPDDEKRDLDDSDGGEPQLSKFLNRLISDAVETRASDIHIEPQRNVVNVRYRIDGHLKNIIPIPKKLLARVMSRIKILAKLDIAERRKFQDGRISVYVEGRMVDLRVSVIPLYHGEKAVVRVLDQESAVFQLDKIGFSPEEKKLFSRTITRPQGVVLLTGPTGSGKTTTIYSALQSIKSETRNIVTIEDPVEYLVEGINQLQLNRVKDITFANCLRSILRQDPDILFVGEIRDKETAEVAFQASLTGHLVFTSLHTNNSSSSIVRLMDIGLEPYLIASSVNLVVSQRLVRVNCPQCKETYTPAKWLKEKYGIPLNEFYVREFVRGKGCADCNFTGYQGRSAIFEMLNVSQRIRSLIYNKASEGVIFNQAVRDGMKTLAQAGVEKVRDGLTTLEEVSSVADVVEIEEDINIMELIQSKRLHTIERSKLCVKV